MKLPQKEEIAQFLKFGIVGISNTLISLAVYYIFLWIDERLYLAGNIVGFIIGVANAFFWNNRFVFTNANDTWQNTVKRLKRTYFSYGATFLLSTLLLYFEVSILGCPAVLCPILNLLITTPVNFLLNKFWTFR